ncbi:MAG: hypothetical protein J1E42_03540 [Akkermansiaceae bacterium]|nr:hypothetical protein [Akkermansiaceae bacterium]
MSRTTLQLIKLILCVDLILAIGLLAEQKLAGADTWLYTTAGQLCGWAKGEYAQLLTPGATPALEPTLRRQTTRSYPPVYYTEWNDDLYEGQTSLPQPRLQELATLLNCMAGRAGIRSVGVSSPLMWEDRSDHMTHLMLAKALSEFPHAIIGLAGRNAAQAQTTPEQLLPAALPAAHVEGSISGLPAANSPLPYFLPEEALSTARLAPDFVDDEPLTHTTTGSAASPGGLSLPLLMRWNGRILPTLPLSLAMAELGLTPEDIHVKLGRSLRLGQRLLPLDAHGRTPLGAARAQALPTGDILNPRAPRTAREGNCAILSRPFSPGTSQHRARHLAASVSALLGQETTCYFPTQRPAGNHPMQLNPLQASTAGRLLLAALLTCALVWLPQLPQRAQRLAPAILGAAAAGLALMWANQGTWMSLCAWALCCTLLIPALRLLRRPPQSS